MRIAQVAPLFESVPPKLCGGTERVVSYLTDELVRRGHEVTLFASADSVTLAKLVSLCPCSIRSDPTIRDPVEKHFSVRTMVDGYEAAYKKVYAWEVLT